MVGHKMIWDYAHSGSVLFSVLLFTAGFLCTLLWTNNIVTSAASVASPLTSTFTYSSPTVSTFTLTYNVAIFGTVWNSILYVVLLVLGRDTLPISTTRLRYDLEKAACTVAVVGNALYAVACIALLATLARLAADVSHPPANLSGTPLLAFEAGASNRQAGFGGTAAMAGFAAVAAMWTCLMDAVHIQYSPHRDSVMNEIQSGEGDSIKQA